MSSASDPVSTDASGPEMRIGDLASELGLTPRTLRYWEERGLMPAARRSEGRYRLYGAAHLRAARGVQRLKDVGFALRDIEAVLRRFGDSATALDGMVGLAAAIREREAEIRERVRRDQELLGELEQLRARLGLCDGCAGKRFDGDCPTCLVEAGGDALPDALECIFQCSLDESPHAS